MSFWKNEFKENIDETKKESQIEMIINMKKEGMSVQDIHKCIPKYTVEGIETILKEANERI
jgi:uncharacterized protein (DUF433 family)